jgi:hypothetical protein
MLRMLGVFSAENKVMIRDYEMKEIFISWSGEKAKIYACFLNKVLNKVFGKRSEIFYSQNIESGTLWLERINQALEEAKVGIIILTRESMYKPWVNYEAGAMHKEKASIIPVCVDISFADLDSHPLRFFQADYYFTWESMEKLFKVLKEKLNWQYELDYLEYPQIQNEFETFINKNNNLCVVEDLLYKNHINVYGSGNFMAEIPEEKIWKIRQEMIEFSKGSIILAGQSLQYIFGEEEAFSLVEKLRVCIIDRKITDVKILITDPTLFNGIKNFDILGSSPLSRISLTMDVLIKDIFPICQKKQCKIAVYFIPLLEIDHAIINTDFMIFRSTKLWTRSGDYKGSFMIYRNSNTSKSEYRAHKNYLEKLMEDSTQIDNGDSFGDGQAEKMYKMWIKYIKFANYSVVKLYKLYYDQIVNYVLNDWKREKSIREFDDSSDI